MKTILWLATVVAWCCPTCFAATHSPELGEWKQWSPRDEIAPLYSIAAEAGREGRSALKITTRRVSEFGAWRTSIPNLRPGQAYRFVTWFRTAGIDNVRRSVIARLHWINGSGKPLNFNVNAPEYPIDVAQTDGWSRMELALRAPENAAALDVQLSLGFSAQGSVWWDRVSLTEIDSLPERIVRVMTIHHIPAKSPSREANIEAFSNIARSAAREQKPDIVCFPEGMTVVGTKQSYVAASESVPGPTTERLGVLARELRAYIVAGLYERVDSVVYNTAVLIDRQGQLVGAYRKTHLPHEEWEVGLTPGDSYPVFQTDFGKIGLMICWDIQFPEPWRALGLQGAELILVPAWGGNETLLRARAIENHAYVISSGYHIKSLVVAPDGATLAEATKETPAVTSTIDLERKIYQPWIGDMRNRTWKERRGELTP